MRTLCARVLRVSLTRYLFANNFLKLLSYSYPNCVPCNCDIYGSLRTTCDQQSGQCNCREYVGGRACDACNANYFNFPRCEECSCDTRGITSSVPGVCLAFTSVSNPSIKKLYFSSLISCFSGSMRLQGERGWTKLRSMQTIVLRPGPRLCSLQLFLTRNLGRCGGMR